MVHVWLDADSMTENCLSFTVDVTDGTGTWQLSAYIRSPAVLDAYPNCWTCLVGWTGSIAQERPVFGASTLQALSLAVPALEALLRINFPHTEFLMNGNPFLLS